jgi:hypothetical protein
MAQEVHASDGARGPTPSWMWIALVLLTLSTVGAMAVHAFVFGSPLAAAQLPITPEPHWGWWLRYEAYWPLGIISLVAPPLALAALAARQLRVAGLALLAFAAFGQTARLALEHHWKQQERAGHFERANPWLEQL